MRKNFVILKCFPVFFAFCLGSSVFADVAPDPLHKGMIPASMHSMVQMVSQDVAIHLGTDWCRVKADFVLLNKADVPASMEVGFPTAYDDEVRNLVVWLNGNKVKTRIEVDYQQPGQDQGMDWYQWALWDMRFAPGEKVTLRVAYSVRPRKNAEEYDMTPYRRHLSQIKEDALPHGPGSIEAEQVLAGITSYSTGYIMITGANWYNAIEDAKVTIHHPLGSGILRWIDPPNHFEVTPDGIAWHFTFIKPDFDISVEFSDNVTLDEEIALVMQALDNAKAGKKEGLIRHLKYLKHFEQCINGNTGT